MKKPVFIIALLLFGTLIVHSQTPVYKVYAIKFAASAYPFTVADWCDGGPKTESVKINFMFWLIKGKGRNILLDAGFLKYMEDAKEFKIIDYIRPDSALLKAGLKANDITDIILSHPHWDHIDGVSLFSNAHVWMQKEDFNYFVSTAWQKGNDNGAITNATYAPWSTLIWPVG